MEVGDGGRVKSPQERREKSKIYSEFGPGMGAKSIAIPPRRGDEISGTPVYVRQFGAIIE